MPAKVEMTSPASSGTALVPEALVGRFQAQGWAVTSPVSAEKPLYAQNKAELVNTANSLGLDADDSLTKKDLVELIEAAQSE